MITRDSQALEGLKIFLFLSPEVGGHLRSRLFLMYVPPPTQYQSEGPATSRTLPPLLKISTIQNQSGKFEIIRPVNTDNSEKRKSQTSDKMVINIYIVHIILKQSDPEDLSARNTSTDIDVHFIL